MGMVLGAVGVGKHYGTGPDAVRALHAVSLGVEAGSFVSVMGPSGSGKSTLLHLLGLLDVPSVGSIELEGADVGSLDDRARTEIRRCRLGFVFQQFNLVPALTAVENVALPLVIGARDRTRRRSLASAALERVGLADRAGHLPGALSGGERQRVAIARAVVHDPAVVLADEPTGSLDSDAGFEIVALLDEIRRDGRRAVVMVTHDDRMAARTDRVVRLLDGRVVPTDAGSMLGSP